MSARALLAVARGQPNQAPRTTPRAPRLARPSAAVAVADLELVACARRAARRARRSSPRARRCPRSRRRSNRRSSRARRRPCPARRRGTPRPEAVLAPRSARLSGGRRRPRRTPGRPPAAISPCGAVREDHGAAQPPSRTSRLEPRPTKSTGSPSRQRAQERREILEVGGHVEARGAARRRASSRAAPSARLASARRAGRVELDRLGHVQLELSVHVRAARATSPIEPAPMVTTTSPSRATRRIAAGISRDRLDEDRLDLAGDAHARARASGRRRRRSAPRRRHRPRRAAARRRSTAPARSPRTGRACACSGAAGTRARSRRPGKAPRAAASVAAISAGWWP